MTDDQPGRALRAIRRYLPDLLGADAPAVDAALVALLRESGDAAYGIRMLEASPDAQAWLADFFETGLPPQVRSRVERGQDTVPDLPGHRVPVGADRYACPIDGLDEWYRVEISDPIPECSDHPGTLLVLAP